MGKEVKETKDLKYMYVFDEKDNAVNAKDITEQDRAIHKYYLKGLDSEGKESREEVIVVLPKNKRNHFRRFPISSNRARVHIGREYNETIVHSLAKRLIFDGSIGWINIPDIELFTPNGTKLIKKTYPFLLKNTQLEYTASNETCKVRFDALCKNGVDDLLAIEIRVEHKCDKEKIDKLNQLGINAVEIDLSHLADSKDLEDGTLESRIIQEIQSGDNIVWLYNKLMDTMNKALSNIVNIPGIRESNPDFVINDGRWYAYKTDAQHSIHRCNSIDEWLKNPDKRSKDRYLTEAECERCPKFMGTIRDINGLVQAYCNQSGMSTSLIQGIITEGLITKHSE